MRTAKVDYKLLKGEHQSQLELGMSQNIMLLKKMLTSFNKFIVFTLK